MTPDTARLRKRGSNNNIIYLDLSSLTILIYDQVAESHIVSTRKTIAGMHAGRLFRIISTGRKVDRT
jgi:hypothetical protein